MAYTTINKSTDYFNTKLYAGNGSTQSITGVGFQPDWTWIKCRNNGKHHSIYDSVRGETKYLSSNLTAAEQTNSGGVTAFNTDGFSVGNFGDVNASFNFASWNWKAGGTAPAITYTVKVVSDSGNKYRFDDFGTSAVTLDLQEGGTYTFDQADSSNSGHPLRFYTAADKTGGEYTTGVTTNGTPGSSGAYTRITVAASAPTLYYQCSNHAGMGGQANTNSLFGSSNFSGSIQTTVSANTTAGFSIVKYTGSGSLATIGHGLSSSPNLVIVKNRDDGSKTWVTQITALGNNYLELNNANPTFSGVNYFNNTAPTTTVFSVKSAASTNASGEDFIAYCFSEVKGYSKIGTYIGNGNADGTFVYTGFKPAFIMLKNTVDTGDNWTIYDNKRDVDNQAEKLLFANSDSTESTGNNIDILSNGFKQRNTSNGNNGSGDTFIYMAFAEAPLVGTNNIPCTAR